MGRAKEHFMELQQIQDETRLAEKLGITYEELCATEWHIETFTSKDGLIYDYVVYFESGPKEILKKIKGLDKDNQVSFQPHEFKDNNHDHE
ncbi:hypothetical protein KBP46_00495 [Chryseobacterium sp. PCH239]|uniref:hypothetical protein n=1 Tax=Chryseobacterium sp. PCH239 TaxID=2825845 RepID=UPI001C0FBEFD|nr:hypothetical protein [Chryseobacterium sp. PCH239]QWT86400.1 hypothetical protein KBP46_00495 [Chryseobacterium sp. PCH239]